MILVACGLPGRFAEDCESLIAALGRSVTPGFRSFNADSLAGLGAALLQNDPGDALAVTRQPATDLVAQLKTMATPFVLAWENPEACVAALMQDHGLNFLEAVRATANSCAAAYALLRLPGALVLHREDAGTMAGIARKLGTHYRLGMAPEEIDAVAQTVTLRQPPPSAHGPGSAGDPDIDRLLPDLAAAALDPAQGWLRTGELQAVVWHRDLFYSGDQSGASPPPWIDVTGPARCLFYGPYIRLPAGNWSCSLLFGCRADAAGLGLVAEIFAGAVLARAEFTVGEAGFFELEFSCNLAADDPVEIRLFNPKAAFEGHICLIQAALRPLKAMRVSAKAG